MDNHKCNTPPIRQSSKAEASPHIKAHDSHLGVKRPLINSQTMNFLTLVPNSGMEQTNIMLWGCFSATRVEGEMETEKYRRILSENLF